VKLLEVAAVKLPSVTLNVYVPAWLMDSVLKVATPAMARGSCAQERAAAAGAGDGHFGRIGGHHIAVLVFDGHKDRRKGLGRGRAAGLLVNTNWLGTSGVTVMVLELARVRPLEVAAPCIRPPSPDKCCSASPRIDGGDDEIGCA